MQQLSAATEPPTAKFTTPLRLLQCPSCVTGTLMVWARGHSRVEWHTVHGPQRSSSTDTPRLRIFVEDSFQVSNCDIGIAHPPFHNRRVIQSATVIRTRRKVFLRAVFAERYFFHWMSSRPRGPHITFFPRYSQNCGTCGITAWNRRVAHVIVDIK